jgi:hypothetical protein
MPIRTNRKSKWRTKMVERQGAPALMALVKKPAPGFFLAIYRADHDIF